MISYANIRIITKTPNKSIFNIVFYIKRLYLFDPQYELIKYSMISKWKTYDSDIEKYLKDENYQNYGNVELAKIVLKTTQTCRENPDLNGFGNYIKRNRNRLLDNHEGIFDAAVSVDVAYQNVPHYWDKTDPKRSVFVKNPNYVPENSEKSITDLQATLIEELQKYSPKFPKLERTANERSHCLVVDPADIHVGKLCSAYETGESYGNQIAVQRVMEGVKGILNKVESFHIDKIVFIGGNDILHVDNTKRSTTSYTPQDTDGQWHDNFLIAKNLYVDILEILLTVADVHFVFNPSNHDYTNGFFLAQVIEAHFRNCENITFDSSIAHRKYFKYHNNLIGSTHGDGAKIPDLPLLMAHESKDWTDCKHKYIYTHHVHHKSAKDYMGVCVESLRSPSGTDSWHHRNGFQFSPKAVEGFLHDKEHGQICRITHLF